MNSPEAPGNLVALDVTYDPSGFLCRVERYDPTDVHSKFLRVSWNAIARPPGYEPVARGAAYVDVPPGFDHRIYEVRPDIAGPRLVWLDKVFGDGLMLIAILPYGHALPSFHDADPPPVAAKLHEGRMAIYWLLAERTRTTWRMEVVEAERIPTLCSELNQEASRQDRRPLLAPVNFVNHAAAGHYPAGLRPDEAMKRFHDLCAWIGEQGGDDAQVSFTGVLLTFLVAADPISRWFQNYVAKRNIAVDDMLSSKGFASQASLETLAAAYTPSGATMRKKPWTPSAREVLTASDALAQRVGGDGCAIGIRHLMGAYCHFHYPNHEAQLRRWGFDLDDWLSEYRKLLKTSDLSPVERAGWHALFKELGILERDVSRGPRPTDEVVAAPPAGWEIFIAHAGSDRATIRRIICAPRSLRPSIRRGRPGCHASSPSTSMVRCPPGWFHRTASALCRRLMPGPSAALVLSPTGLRGSWPENSGPKNLTNLHRSRVMLIVDSRAATRLMPRDATAYYLLASALEKTNGVGKDLRF